MEPAAGAGPVSLLMADPGIDFARLTPCRRHGAADLKANAPGAGPQHVFSIAAWKHYCIWDTVWCQSGELLLLG